MKNSKKIIIGVGIANLLTFILIVAIPCYREYRYLTVMKETEALVLLIISFIPFYITFLVLTLKRKKDKTLKFNLGIFISIVFFCLISVIYLIVIRYLYADVLESQTTNVANYMVLDNGAKCLDIEAFPKNISKNAKNVKYKYEYITIDGDFWDSDYDLYLEMELPEEEYILEKERIKSLTDFEKIDHGFYLNSSEEYIKYYIKISPGYRTNNRVQYYFATFFDEENKIIYNFSFGYIKPYFISINEDNIKCESEICRID